MNPPPPMTGNSPATSWLNRLRDFCISERVLSGPGYRRRKSASGVSLEFDSQPGGGGKTQIAFYQFRVMNLDDMDCYSWDDVAQKAGSKVIKVIKPPLLKGSLAARTAGSVHITYAGYNATAQSRIATTANGPITQIITPMYVQGDIILGFALGSRVYDLNIDGRVFAGPSQ